MFFRLYTVPLFTVALLLGGLSAVNPAMLGVAVIIVSLTFAVILLLIIYPQKALYLSFLLVLLADTKFRERDPTATLYGHIDPQIIFELVLFFLVLLIIIVNYYSFSFRNLRPTSEQIFLFAYVLLAIVSSLWSHSFQLTIVRGAQMLILWMLCFVAVRELGPQGVLQSITVSLVFYVLFFSLIAVIFPWARDRPPDSFNVSRFSWFSVHPISVGILAGVAAILVIVEGFFSATSWRGRIIGLPIWLDIIPLLFVLTATRSRGPIVAFVVVLLIVGMIRYVGPWMTSSIGYITLMAFVILIGAGFSAAQLAEDILARDNFLATFLLRNQSTESLLTFSGRTELWQGSYELFLDRPILGYGYLASRRALLGLMPWAGYAHSAFMQTILDLGIAGAALLWYILGTTLLSCFFRCGQINKYGIWYGNSILGILLILLLNSFTDSTFAGPSNFIILLLFVSVFTQSELKLYIR